MVQRLKQFCHQLLKKEDSRRPYLWRTLLLLSLVLDLVLFPNCFPPVPDTNPKTLNPGKSETGLTFEGSWFFLFPQSLSWEFRHGLNQGLEINGRVEWFLSEYLREYRDSIYQYSTRQEGLFVGPSLGFKQSLGSPHFAIASHLGLYSDFGARPLLLSRSYLLMGAPHLHVSLGAHAFYVHQWHLTPSFGLGTVLGKRNHFKLGLHLERFPGSVGEGPSANGYMPSIGLGYSYEY
jgi:hypothetical protein